MAMVTIGGSPGHLASAPFHALFFFNHNPKGEKTGVSVRAIAEGLLLATATCAPMVGAWQGFQFDGAKTGYNWFILRIHCLFSCFRSRNKIPNKLTYYLMQAKWVEVKGKILR